MKTVWTILALLFLIAIIGGGYYFDKKMKDQRAELTGQVIDLKNKMTEIDARSTQASEEAKSAQNKVAEAVPAAVAPVATPETPAATPTAPPDTASWKSFNYTKFNYTIKYPTDWVYKDVTTGIPLSIVGFRPKNGKEDLFSLYIEKSNLDYTIAGLKKQYKDSWNFKSQSETDLNSLKFTLLNCESKTDAKIKPIIYLTAKDDKVYYFIENTNADTAINNTTAAIGSTFSLTK